MADGFVQVATDGSGKKVDSSEITVGANTVERQRIVIADPASATGILALAAKGTQNSSFLPTQDAKDSGRTPITLYLDRVTGITTEALATLNKNVNGTVTTGTSYTVTTGKTFRIQSIAVAVRATTTVLVSGRVRLRVAATVSATSPIFALGEVSSFSAVAESIQWAMLEIPDGLEIAAGQQIGVSHVESATSATLSMVIIGFEY